MKKGLLAIVLGSVVALTACTSVDFEPFVGDNNSFIGEGGTVKTFDGVDVWTSGAPNKPFKVLGYVNGQMYEGWGTKDMLYSSVASEAKKHGADAVIKVSSDRKYVNTVAHTNYSGNFTANTSYYGNSAYTRGNTWGSGTTAAGSNYSIEDRYAAIKYLE